MGGCLRRFRGKRITATSTAENSKDIFFPNSASQTEERKEATAI
jgi:hypothetical protein